MGIWSMFNPILCTPEQHQIISALPIRFQRIITWYSIALKFHCDDLTRIDQVLDGQILFYYPSKSGVNGALFIAEHMNDLYTYDHDNHEDWVCKILPLEDKKRILLRWCNNTSHLPRKYQEEVRRMT